MSFGKPDDDVCVDNPSPNVRESVQDTSALVWLAESRLEDNNEAMDNCCEDKGQTELFEKSKSFQPDIFGEQNPYYKLDWDGCGGNEDHVMLGKIWMSCEQLSDQAGYSAYRKLVSKGKNDNFTSVFEAAKNAYLRAIPRPEDITFLILPHSQRHLFTEVLEKEADDHAEEVVINLMMMMD